jgi:hypothetical protein
MLLIFGDSHARFNFKNLSIPNLNLSENSITMHRIGRDNTIAHFNPEYNSLDNIFILCYGEVDCRCHIARQIALGRDKYEICKSLVENYFNTIKNNIISYKSIIIVSVTPPTSKKLFNLPDDFPFPMLGDDEERVDNTKIINSLLEEYCKIYGYTFLNIYNFYADYDGTLCSKYSDMIVHIEDNKYILEKVSEILSNLNS